jgi:hypothetical protein
LSPKRLIEKLVETKNTSKTNQARNKATTNFITVNFFSKFLKAKVDKSRPFEELQALVAEAIDMDRDGCISVCDIEGFIGRRQYQEFVERPLVARNNSKAA